MLKHNVLDEITARLDSRLEWHRLLCAILQCLYSCGMNHGMT